jgi:hypothetical protein
LRSESHLNGEVFSILFSDQVIFYFTALNKIVPVRFEANISVPSAKNVYLFQADTQQLKMSGHFALLFGMNNYSLILIDPLY